MTIWLLWLAAILVCLASGILPVRRGWRAALLMTTLVAVACLAPFLLPAYRVSQLARMWALAVSLLGLNVTCGYGGQLSLGQGGFMLLGAYTLAILTDRVEQLGAVDARPWPFWAALFAAAAVGAAAGLVVGMVSLRWKGVFLALGTFAASLALPHVLLRYDNFSGGARGIRFPPTPPPPFLQGVLSQQEWLYYLGLLSFLICLLVTWNLLRGPWGRSLVATRDSEIGAKAMGVDVTKAKVQAFTVSAALGGAAGALYAMPLRFVMHETIEPLESIYLFLALIVGGLGSLGSAIPAAALLVYLPTDMVQVVGRLPGLGVELVARAPGLIQGAIVVAILLLAPQGLVPVLERLWSSTPAAIHEQWAGAVGRLAARAARAYRRWQYPARSSASGEIEDK
jgi:branched-chain amino acid transport system permease protein